MPGAVVVHLANQVRVSAELYPSYEWSGRTIEELLSEVVEIGRRPAARKDERGGVTSH